jgi:hypothetical protein
MRRATLVFEQIMGPHQQSISSRSASAARSFFAKAFRWQRGRQLTGYDKMLLFESLWPLPWDLYLLRFTEGAEIAAHTDPVSIGAHHRLNIVLREAGEGGQFQCAQPLYESRRIKYFRPDLSEHSVTKVTRGTRYVLSVGWVRRAR